MWKISFLCSFLYFPIYFFSTGNPPSKHYVLFNRMAQMFTFTLLRFEGLFLLSLFSIKIVYTVQFFLHTSVVEKRFHLLQVNTNLRQILVKKNQKFLIIQGKLFLESSIIYNIRSLFSQSMQPFSHEMYYCCCFTSLLIHFYSLYIIIDDEVSFRSISPMTETMTLVGMTLGHILRPFLRKYAYILYLQICLLPELHQSLMHKKVTKINGLAYVARTFSHAAIQLRFCFYQRPRVWKTWFLGKY